MMNTNRFSDGKVSIFNKMMMTAYFIDNTEKSSS